MAFLGDWRAGETLTLYLQTVNPDTGAAFPADVFPTYRVYHAVTQTPVVTGTYALQDSTGTTGFYVASLPLSTIAGFAAGTTYAVRTAVTIVGATEAIEDTFSIASTPQSLIPARMVWRANSAATRRLVNITPARIHWQAQGFRSRTITLQPARLRWQPRSMFPLALFPRTAFAWTARPVRIAQDFPFRETTPALAPSASLVAFLAAVGQTVIVGDWLVQSQRLGLRLSLAYNPDGTWEHRLLDLSDVEITVAPGGGLATVANASFTVAENGVGQSLIQIWHRFATIGGKADITIDFRFGDGTTFRIFTGLIDTITIQNGRSQVLCVDESIQRNLQLPQILVTSALYPLAGSGALTHPLPLVYGQGSHLTAAPLLFTNTATLAYTAAAHPVTLAPTLAVFNADASRYMPGTVSAVANPATATVLLARPLQQTLLNTQSMRPILFTQQNVTNAGQAIDGDPGTLATVGTGTLASNLDGQGFLGVLTPTTGDQRGNNQAVITLTNHRRALYSDPTVTGQFLVQTVEPTTGQVLRSALFTTQNFRHSLNPQTTIQTIPNLTLGAHEAVEVLLLARNEGGPGNLNNYYEIGEMSIQTGYLPQGDTFPIFLYQGFDGRRDQSGAVTQAVNALYTLPSHVIGSLLHDELGLTLSATFALAHTFYAGVAYLFDGGLGYSWFVTRAPVRQILDDAARQALAVLSPDLLGQWGLRPFQDTAPIHFPFTPSTILCTAGATDATASDSLVLTMGNMAQVHCRFEIHYRWNAGAQKFDGLMTATEAGTNAVGHEDLAVLCQLSALRYGITEPLILDAYWIADTDTAIRLLRHVVRYWSFQRLTVTFDTTFQALALQLGDMVSITHPGLPIGDQGGTFETHTIRTSPTTGRCTLTCSKIAAVFLDFFLLYDQTGVLWYFWFDTNGDLSRDTHSPAIFPFLNEDVTGAFIPWWHQVSDPVGGTWFLWPNVDGALTIDSAHPAIGYGLVTGLGQTAVALNTHTYRLGAGVGQEITLEELD